jgi:hypothetical protein
MSSSSSKQQLYILITNSEVQNSGREGSSRSKRTPIEPVRLMKMLYKNCGISLIDERLPCTVRIQDGLRARKLFIAIYFELGLKYAIKNVHEN